MNLDITIFRELIQSYYQEPRPDPFLAWYWEKVNSKEINDAFRKVLVTLIDARFDQVTTAENALENTIRIYNAGLIRDYPASLEEVPSLIPVGDDTSEDWTEKFYFAHRTLIEVSKDVLKKKEWEAEELTKYIQRIPYIGPKTSRLAVRWLDEIVEELSIDMRNYHIPIDRNIYRVTSRLGIIDPYKDKYWIGYNGGRADELIQQFARTIFPDNPGLIDEPIWCEGRRWRDGGHCNSKNPIHTGCLFEEICPKLHCDIDPVKHGMISYKRESYKKW